jgi:hypothetical protein
MTREALIRVLEAALAAGLPCRYTLPTRAATSAWRHQFYRLRKAEPAGSVIASLSLRRTGDTTLWIEHAPVGVLASTTGEAIAVAPPSSLADLDSATLADMLGIDLGEPTP